MELSLRRMMDVCASLSKSFLVAYCEYVGWGMKSSFTNSGANIARVTSCRTFTALKSVTLCALSLCSSTYSISTPRLYTTTGRHSKDVMSRVNDRACVHERAKRLEEPGERRTRARATSAEAVLVMYVISPAGRRSRSAGERNFRFEVRILTERAASSAIAT